MPAPVRLDRQALDDLKLIRELPIGSLELVLAKLRQIAPAPRRPEKLYGAAAEAIPNEVAAGQAFVRQALMQHVWLRRRQYTIPEVLQGIRDALLNDSDWSAVEREKWNQAEGKFAEILSLLVVRLVSRAVDLSFEHPNLLTEVRILTDIRPIYADDAASIDGAVVSHSLVLRYDCIEGAHEITLAVDEADIKELAEQCERAFQKAQTAQAVMKQAKIPTMIAGAEEDA